MDPSDAPPPVAPWTASQRRALLIVIAIILSILTYRYFHAHTYVDDPLPPDGPRAAEMADRLDPNSADAASLSSIPTLGPKRAQDIYDYRVDFTKNHPGQVAFRDPYDLLRIKGIGAATVEAITPYLIFPPSHPTTKSH